MKQIPENRSRTLTERATQKSISRKIIYILSSVFLNKFYNFYKKIKPSALNAILRLYLFYYDY